jgi:hypothetical protein
MAYSKQPFNGVTAGQPILVSGTAPSLGVRFHIVPSGAGEWDEIYVYACNVSSADVDVAIAVGVTDTAVSGWVSAAGVSKPAVWDTIPAQDGAYLLIPGMLVGASSPVALSAYCPSGVEHDNILLHGYVNRIT